MSRIDVRSMPKYQGKPSRLASENEAESGAKTETKTKDKTKSETKVLASERKPLTSPDNKWSGFMGSGIVIVIMIVAGSFLFREFIGENFKFTDILYYLVIALVFAKMFMKWLSKDVSWDSASKLATRFIMFALVLALIRYGFIENFGWSNISAGIKQKGPAVVKGVKDFFVEPNPTNRSTSRQNSGWHEIYRKTFKGKGLGPNDKIKTAKLGRDVFYGNKIIVLGDKFQVYRSGRYQNCSRKEIIKKVYARAKPGKDDYFEIKAPNKKYVEVIVFSKKD